MSVGTSKLVRGRKRHHCAECRCPLPVGQIHVCHSYLDEENNDGWFTTRNCLACNDLAALVVTTTFEQYEIGSLNDEFQYAFDDKHMQIPEVIAFYARANFWAAQPSQIINMPPSVREYRAKVLGA